MDYTEYYKPGLNWQLIGASLLIVAGIVVVILLLRRLIRRHEARFRKERFLIITVSFAAVVVFALCTYFYSLVQAFPTPAWLAQRYIRNLTSTDYRICPNGSILMPSEDPQVQFCDSMLFESGNDVYQKQDIVATCHYLVRTEPLMAGRYSTGILV